MGKIVLISKGIKELLKSDEMMQVCKEQANVVQQRAGDGYSVNTYVGKYRVNAEVRADTRESIKDCLKNNTLLKAVGNHD